MIPVMCASTGLKVFEKICAALWISHNTCNEGFSLSGPRRSAEMDDSAAMLEAWASVVTARVCPPNDDATLVHVDIANCCCYTTGALQESMTARRVTLLQANVISFVPSLTTMPQCCLVCTIACKLCEADTDNWPELLMRQIADLLGPFWIAACRRGWKLATSEATSGSPRMRTFNGVSSYWASSI